MKKILIRFLTVGTMGFFLAGCATDLSKSTTLAKTQTAEFVPSEIMLSTNDQDVILSQLMRRAGLAGNAPSAGDWDRIIAAGIEYSDLKCQAYLNALARLEHQKKTSVAQIGLISTAAAGIMQAAKAAAKDIAMVAIALGLTSSTIENLGGNLLYDVETSSVHTIVESLQANYRDAIPRGYISRPAAVSVIRGYAVLCTPVRIEAEINHAIKNAQPKVALGDPNLGKAPVVTNAQITVDAKYGPDDTSKLISQFIRVDGVIVDAPRRKVEAFMRASGINDQVSVIAFLNSAEYAEQRLKAVQFFHLVK